MLIPRDNGVLVTGNSFPWAATYKQDQVCGPFDFELAEEPLLTSCCGCFNALSESLAIADDVRGTHKGKIARVSMRGTLPFGTGVGFRHTHHYAEHTLRAVTDLRIPPGTELKSPMHLDDLTLPGRYGEWRTLTSENQLTDWQPLGDEQVWSSHPHLIILRRDDGAELEIGVGTDVWRWQNALGIDSNRGVFRLFPEGNTLNFQRQITVPTEVFTIPPRDYRFSWYLAWSPPTLEADTAAVGLGVFPWHPDGTLELASAREMLADPDAILALDFQQIPASDEWRRSDAGICFASRAAVKRIKRAIRQLASLDLTGRTLEIRGLTPGYCEQGHHVAGKHTRPHWDMAEIIELGAWIRSQLPNTTRLINKCDAWDIPSIRHLFADTDHDEDPFVYNYVPISNEGQD